MAARPLTELMEPGWARAMAPVADQIADMGTTLRAELAAGRTYLPAAENVLRAFTYPLDAVRVLVVGQDPYPTPGNAVGLSFSVAPDVAIPASLRNMFTELVDDLGVPAPTTGDLTPWAERGVMLLNRVLTVRPGAAGSHRGMGWEAVTEHARRDPVGPPGRHPLPAPRSDAAGRLRASLTVVGVPGVLRVEALLADERAAAGGGR
jgi:uracil-DNA glycosylase